MTTTWTLRRDLLAARRRVARYQVKLGTAIAEEMRLRLALEARRRTRPGYQPHLPGTTPRTRRGA